MENINAFELLTLLHNSENIQNKFEKISGSKLINNKIVDGTLIIGTKNFDYNLTFENCTFDSIFSSEVNWSGTLEFSHCTFKKDFTIGSFVGINLIFENCQFEKSITFDYCNLSYINFIKCESTNGVQFNGGEIYLLTIDPINEKTHFSFIGKFLLINNLNIKSVSGITLITKSCIINKINLTGYLNIGSRLDFNSIINKEVLLNDINNDGKIYFSNLKATAVQNFLEKPIEDYIDKFETLYSKNKALEIKYLRELDPKTNFIELIKGRYTYFEFRKFIEDLYYQDFLNYETIRPIYFKISNSSAGILELKNIKFEMYNLELINSDLSSIKLINSKIPPILVQDDFLNYYNIYNDLYSSANKQNNTKDKVEYYKISQHFLLKYLRFEAGSPLNMGSIIAIIVSGIYSKHGTNWIKAIFATLIITFIFFCLFIANIQGIYFDLSKNGIKNFIENLLPYFPQFLNPLHKIEFMDLIGSLSGWSGLIDLLGRIFVSIGIFEIIRSFRKHVRQ